MIAHLAWVGRLDDDAASTLTPGTLPGTMRVAIHDDEQTVVHVIEDIPVVGAPRACDAQLDAGRHGRRHGHHHQSLRGVGMSEHQGPRVGTVSSRMVAEHGGRLDAEYYLRRVTLHEDRAGGLYLIRDDHRLAWVRPEPAEYGMADLDADALLRTRTWRAPRVRLPEGTVAVAQWSLADGRQVLSQPGRRAARYLGVEDPGV